MKESFEVYPAYGRVYKNIEDITRDWNNNKDFRTKTGHYINKQDAKHYDCSCVIYIEGKRLLLET